MRTARVKLVPYDAAGNKRLTRNNDYDIIFLQKWILFVGSQNGGKLIKTNFDEVKAKI